VSKAQGRYVSLDTIVPSERAAALGVIANKDPRLVEVILSESVQVVRRQTAEPQDARQMCKQHLRHDGQQR
jgi:F420-0:gamma-glutamyl ligase